MKTPMKLTMLGLAALAFCSGCASKPTTTSFYSPTATYITPTSLQATVNPQWDEAVAASTAAKVNNNGLIMMR